MGTLKEMFRDLVKTGLCWLGYEYRDGLAIAAVRGAEAVLDHPVTERFGKGLKKHWEKSRKAARWAKWALTIAILGGFVFGLAALYPMELGMARKLRWIAGLVFIAPAALVFLKALWHFGKGQALVELVIFSLLEARLGYEEAIRLLPNFIGKKLSGITDPIIMPVVSEARRITNLIWSAFIGAVALALFIFDSRIHENPAWFFAVLLSGAGLVGWVIRYRPETQLLRYAAFWMPVATIVIAACISIYPSFRTIDGIRDDCIAQYFNFGVPKDADQEKLCVANVETEIMANLLRFNELKCKKPDKGDAFKCEKLNSQERMEFDALDTVLKGAKEGNPKPLVISEPPAPKTVTTTASATDIKSKDKPKPAVIAGSPKPSQKQELLARMKVRQEKIDTLLGKKQ